MNFCLSDLVPPLRWSDAAEIPALRDQSGLPEGWWRSLPMSRVLLELPPEALGELVAELAMNQWPAAALGDVLPALHVMDPEEADGPHTSMALDRAGSWPGLLALTSRELLDQPFIQARPVLLALFTAAFNRFAATAGKAAESTPAPELPKRIRRGELPEDTPDPRTESQRPALPRRIPQPVNPPPQVDPGLGFGRGRQEGGPLPTRKPRSSGRPSPLGGPVQPPAPPARPSGLFEPPAERPAAPPGPAGAVGTPASIPGLSRIPGLPPIPPIPGLDDAPELGSTSGRRSLFEPFRPQEPKEPAQEEQGRSSFPPDAAPPAEPQGAADAGPADALDAEAAPVETDLFALVDSVFAGLDDKSWAVAQNRLFTDSPGAVEELAKLFAVPPSEIEEIEADLRVRLKKWLVSDEARAYRDHLTELQQRLGRAVPKEWLIQAAEWHARELRSLEVPAWQFVLASLPGHRLVDGWVVEGDPSVLQERTRRLIASAERPPTLGKALEMVASLGIHPDVAEEWLRSVPQLRIQLPQEAEDVPAPVPAADGEERHDGAAVQDDAPDGHRDADGEPEPVAEQRAEDGSAGAEAQAAPADALEDASAAPEARGPVEVPAPDGQRAVDAPGADALEVPADSPDRPGHASDAADAATPADVPGAAMRLPDEEAPDDRSAQPSGDVIAAGPAGPTEAPPASTGPADAEPAGNAADAGAPPHGPSPMDQVPSPGEHVFPAQDALPPPPPPGPPGTPEGRPFANGVRFGQPAFPPPPTRTPPPAQGQPIPPENSFVGGPALGEQAFSGRDASVPSVSGLPGPADSGPIRTGVADSGPPAFPGPDATDASAPVEDGADQDDAARAKAFKPLKDVSLTRRCFRQPDGRWWLRVDITDDHLQGGECALPSGFAAYLGMAPGESRTVQSSAGEVTLTWQNRPVVRSLAALLKEASAQEGDHLFLTLSQDGMLRARHLPAAGPDVEPIERALRLVGYTAPGGTPEQASRVIATRIGMPGSAEQADILARLRERGDRDLLALLA